MLQDVAFLKLFGYRFDESGGGDGGANGGAGDGGANGGAGDGGANGGAGDGGANGGAGDGGANGDNRTFTQQQVNEMVAAERRKAEGRQIAELERIRNSASTSETQRRELEVTIERLRQESNGERETLKGQLSASQRELQRVTSSLTTDRDFWRGQYTDSRITSELTTAAAANEAYSTNQVVALLRGRTTLEERLDEKGKGLGVFEVRVKLTDIDEKGQPVEMSLTPADAVARMKQNVAEYGNLFKSTMRTGFGGNNQGAGGKTVIKSQGDYSAARATILSRHK